MMILRGEKGGDTGVEVEAETVNVATGGTEGVGAVITTGTETTTDPESGIGIEMSADIAAVVIKMTRAKGVIDDEEIGAGTADDQGQETIADAAPAPGPVDETKGPRLKFLERDHSNRHTIPIHNSTKAKGANDLYYRSFLFKMKSQSLFMSEFRRDNVSRLKSCAVGSNSKPHVDNMAHSQKPQGSQ